MAKKKQGKKHSNRNKSGSGRKQTSQPNEHDVPSSSPPPATTTTTTTTTATAAAEKRLIAELYTLSRSLLASLPGCAPDGSPLTHPEHPLARLHSQLMDKVSELMALQKERASSSTCMDANKRSGSITDRENPEAWTAFRAWLKECGIHGLEDASDAKESFPVEIRRSNVAASSIGADEQKEEEEEGKDRSTSQCSDNHEYGLFATRDIAYDEVVLKIPIHAMMCPYFKHVLAADDSATPMPPPPFDPNRPLAQDLPLRPLCLITYLANERYRGGASAFAPYIDTLPDGHPTPLYWSVQDMRRGLAVTCHLRRAVMMQAKLVWDYIQAREMIDETHKESASPIQGLIPTRDFTFELFRWATVTAHTRQNLIPFPVSMSRRHGIGSTEGNTNDIEQAHGFVPLWDIINHEDSDRACRTDCEFVDDAVEPSAGKAVNGYLICKTPSNRPKGNVPCFHAGEEITMYYGARSNAQLLFHSGFVNCSEDILSAEAEAEAVLSSDNNLTSTTHRFNRNRTDCALLRIALPPAAKDVGLDRIREMIAARFGFRAFTDQGIDHDGLEAAEAAASVIETSGADTTQTSNGKGEAKNSAAGTLRKAAEVVMMEVEVSPVDCVPIDLRNALLLCVADKDELTHLLRNMDTYTSREDASANISDSGNGGVPQDLLKLGKKHLVLAEELVKVQKRRRRKKQESIDPASGTDCASLRLALCDEETLSIWLNSFRSHFDKTMGRTNA